MKTTTPKIYRYTLTEDVEFYNARLKGYHSSNAFGTIINGLITIKAGYSWDGCSPKFINICGLYIGTPDFNNKTKQASLIHDFLYQYKIGTREIADNIFYDELRLQNFPLAGLYYNAVRKFGKKYW